ncbi:hypothetical protein [Stenotrophomonas pigmentata]|uniref:hypothetical protein n=1 Tax=Stenotrophomonas pigmentata TaxID=3055080 RepID=UPI0026EEB38B|nr:hypothetical protein [Stenotrophomonas sp. 610A2]
MNGLSMFLEGPGLERRAVQLLRTERVPLDTLLHHATSRAAVALIDLHILIDNRGNVATQIDHEGLRYRFPESNAPWALIVG